MAYLGFARKYRPQTFDEVAGQQEIAITLKNAIQNNRVHHAYIFAGSKGVGKTSMARIFSKALNCENGPTTTPCNQCELCRHISTGEDIDVVEIDGASNRGIEEIRSIKENVKYLTSRARYKIFIIDEVHMLTQAAFNALLKTLEEPPAHVKFILATTAITSIPDTILSRCQRFQFKKIELENIVTRLLYIAKQEKLELSQDGAKAIALAARGALRDSVVLFDQVVSYADGHIDQKVIEKFLGNMGGEACEIIESLHKKDVVGLLSVIENFIGIGGEPSSLLEVLIQQSRDLLVASMTETEQFIEGDSQYKEWIAAWRKNFTPEFMTMAIHHLIEAKNMVYRSLMGRIVLETVLLKILRNDSLLPLKKIEQTLLSLDRNIPKGLQNQRAGGGEIPASVLVGLDPQHRVSRPPVTKTPPLPMSQPAVIQETAKAPVETKEAVQKPVAPVEESHPNPWLHFVDLLAKQFPQAAELLRKEAKIEVQEHCLAVTMPQEYHMVTSMLNTPKNKPLVHRLLSQCFQREIPLHFQFKGSENARSSRKELELKINQDSVVLKTLELFDGRIVGSQESKK